MPFRYMTLEIDEYTKVFNLPGFPFDPCAPVKPCQINNNNTLKLWAIFN